MKRSLALLAATLAATPLALAATPLALADQLPFTYAYNTSPDSGYPDSGGELNDGKAANIAWGGGNITFADVAGLVGWQHNNPSITFTFASPVTITSVVAWFADSNGAAGVALPSSITLSDGAGFSQVFGVTDPDGAGSTIPVTLDGFSLTTSTLTLTAQRTSQWTMASEVQVFSTPIPEPATYAAGLGLLALAAAAYRRRA